MAQKRLTEYFQNRKRAEIQYDVHPSKRAKLEPRVLRSKLVDTEVELGKTEEKTVAVSTACLDDHSNVLPSTPTKRSLRSGHSTSSKKRSRVVDKADLSEGFKTPEKGYDFSVFASGDRTSESTSARRRLHRKKLEPQDTILNIKPKAQKSALVDAVKNTDAFKVKKQTNNVEKFSNSVLKTVDEGSTSEPKDCWDRTVVGAKTPKKSSSKKDSNENIKLKSHSGVLVDDVKSLAALEVKTSSFEDGKEKPQVTSHDTVNDSVPVEIKGEMEKLVTVDKVGNKVFMSVDKDGSTKFKDCGNKVSVGTEKTEKALSANGGNEQSINKGDASQREKPKKLEDNVEMMKKRLASCTSLAQLREALARADKSKAKLKQVAAEPKGKPVDKEEVKQREGLGNFELDRDILKKRLAESDQAKAKLNQIAASVSTVQSEQRDIASEKSSEVKVAAHDRFHALAAKVPPSLILPVSYGFLLEIFNCTEIIVSRLHNRSEICTFNKLKMGVEQMTKKRFDERHLGQIKTVLPTAYHFRQEKDLPSGTGGKISNYQLTVEAFLDDSTLTKSGDAVKNKLSEDGHKLTPAKLVERRNHFHQNLINIVKRYHAEFLSTLKMPLKVPDDKLTRWHALFEVDKVPEIEIAPLPQKLNERKIYSAQEALEFVRNKCDKRVLQALEVVASKSSSSSSTVSNKPNSPNSKVPPPGLLGIKSQLVATTVKGIDPELLARIRAKEALKATQQMTRTPEEQQRLERLQRLPQFVRILKCYFDGQKRPAIPVNDIISTFVDSYRTSISPVEAERHLRLLAETVPEWVTLVRISRGEYVKVDRNLDVNMIASKVQKVADDF